MRASPTRDDVDEVVHRLYEKTKISDKNAPVENNCEDSIVSDLPSETLRWIKKRRHFDSDQKVVLSHFRDKQLREMFQSLDYKNEGGLDLTELTEAVTYVQEKTKHIKGLEAFRNIQELFAAMDDNGDGTVDFQEFTRAMTGTQKSAFDQASEYDIQRIFYYFVEFGVKRQREKVLNKITEANELDRNRLPLVDSPNKPKSRAKKNTTKPYYDSCNNLSPDMQAYNQFKVLFGFPEDNVGKGGNRSRPSTTMSGSRTGTRTTSPFNHGLDSSNPEHEMSPKKIFALVEKDEKLLDHFVHDLEERMQKDHSLDIEKQAAYKQIQQKYKEERRRELEVILFCDII